MKTSKWNYLGAFVVSIIFLLVSACISTPTFNTSNTETVDGITYAYSVSNNVATLGSGIVGVPAISPDTSGALNIPSTLGGYPVKRLGMYACVGCSKLTSVDIPSGVNEIDFDAFRDCRGLTIIAIPNSVTNIGRGAFLRCVELKEITIQKTVTAIGRYAFSACHSLPAIAVDSRNPFYSSIDGVLFDKAGKRLINYPGSKLGAYIIPDSVTDIGQGAFTECNGLTSVTIPKSVKTIGDGAFSGCANLTSVTISEGIHTIESWAFNKCRRLTMITLPRSVEKVGHGMLARCNDLKTIHIQPGNPNYSSVDGILFSKDGTLLVAYPCDRQGAYSVPNGVNKIETAAFCGAMHLTALTIPASVQHIGSEFGAACPNLQSITVDANNAHFSSVDDVLFDKKGLRLLTYPSAKQGAYVIPDSVVTIRRRAFSECNGLTAVTIPEGIKYIQDQAFRKCTGLTSMAIPASTVSVGHYVFQGCTNITSVTVPGCVTNLQKTFYASYSKITNVVRHAAIPQQEKRND